MNGLGGCGCSGKIESLGSYSGFVPGSTSGFVPGSTSGFGLNPDGLGDAAPATVPAHCAPYYKLTIDADGRPMCLPTPTSNAVDFVRQWWKLGLVASVPVALSYAYARKKAPKHVTAWTAGGVAAGIGVIYAALLAQPVGG
jgi:hypothetical protein